MRIRIPYLRVFNVPAKNRSVTVIAMLSKVYTGSALCFSCIYRELQVDTGCCAPGVNA